MSPARCLGVILVLMCGIGEALAHPHVWITARSEIIFSPDGSITGVRHAWTFDEMFSTYALQGIATAKQGVYTRDELAPLALTNVEALKDFAYFTVARSDGRKKKFGDPSDYYFARENEALTLYFTLPFRTPVMSKQLVLDIFDPSYFIAFSMEKQDPVRLIGAPAQCGAALRPPSEEVAASRKLSEDDFLNGDNDNYGALFANHITVACP